MRDIIDHTIAEICSRRRFGRVTCRLATGEFATSSQSVVDVVDNFVSEFGFVGLGGKWVEVSKSQAKAIGQEILSRDLAYRLQIMPESDASSLAERFTPFFGIGLRCFTNGNIVLSTVSSELVPGAWNPISAATCVDGSQIGILWVEDED